MKISEFFGFFFRYLRNPSSVGAVCPSSRFLARKMAAPLCGFVKKGDSVAELGAGTGAVSEYLLKVPELSVDKLYCIEFEKDSAHVLSRKFPDVKVFNDSAENIVCIMGADVKRLKCVVSSLPLLSLPKECAASILGHCQDALPSGGMFVQFTYNLAHSPAEEYLTQMRRVKTYFVPLNLPPARVDVFIKQ